MRGDINGTFRKTTPTVNRFLEKVKLRQVAPATVS